MIKRKFKPGDKVRVIANSYSKCPWNDKLIGTIQTIKEYNCQNYEGIDCYFLEKERNQRDFDKYGITGFWSKNENDLELIEIQPKYSILIVFKDNPYLMQKEAIIPNVLSFSVEEKTVIIQSIMGIEYKFPESIIESTTITNI